MPASSNVNTFGSPDGSVAPVNPWVGHGSGLPTRSKAAEAIPMKCHPACAGGEICNVPSSSPNVDRPGDPVRLAPSIALYRTKASAGVVRCKATP